MKSPAGWMRGMGWAAVLLVAGVAASSTASALEGTFTRPTYNRQARLDACYFWGRECGRKPADTYCQVQGYQRSVRFETEPVRPTRLASGRTCDAEFCMGFKSITCVTSAPQRGRTTYWPQRLD